MLIGLAVFLAIGSLGKENKLELSVNTITIGCFIIRVREWIRCQRYINEGTTNCSKSVNSKINGKEMSLCPGIELNINKKLHFGPEFQWEYRWAEKNDGYFLWEQRNVMDPGLRIRWESEMADVSMKCSFRYENIEEKFEIFRSDNRSICLSSEASINPFSFLVLNLFADYQYRKYAPFGIYGRITENLSVSGSIMIKL